LYNPSSSNFALIRILFAPQPATPMSRVDCIAGEPRMTDEEYEDAYREALLCLSEITDVGQPFGRGGVRICSVDGCVLDDVKGRVAMLASSNDSFAIGEPCIPPLSKACWRLRICNGLQLTVCDRVRLLTVLLTTRQGVDYGRKESRQMCPSRVQMPGAQGQQVLWSLLPGFGWRPISLLHE